MKTSTAYRKWLLNLAAEFSNVEYSSLVSAVYTGVLKLTEDMPIQRAIELVRQMYADAKLSRATKDLGSKTNGQKIVVAKLENLMFEHFGKQKFVNLGQASIILDCEPETVRRKVVQGYDMRAIKLNRRAPVMIPVTEVAGYHAYLSGASPDQVMEEVYFSKEELERLIPRKDSFTVQEMAEILGVREKYLTNSELGRPRSRQGFIETLSGLAKNSS